MYNNGEDISYKKLSNAKHIRMHDRRAETNLMYYEYICVLW